MRWILDLIRSMRISRRFRSRLVRMGILFLQRGRRISIRMGRRVGGDGWMGFGELEYFQVFVEELVYFVLYIFVSGVNEVHRIRPAQPSNLDGFMVIIPGIDPAIAW